MTKKTLLILLAFFVSKIIAAQNLTESQLKALYVLKLAEYFTWPNEKIDTFTVGFYGADTQTLNSLKRFALKQKIKNRPVKIKQFEYIDNIKNSQILYLSKDVENQLPDVFDKIASSNTLLISDDAIKKKYIMINLIPSDKQNKLKFEVHKANILLQNLKMSPKILLLGGTELDVAKLYQKTAEELKIEKERVIQQKKQLEHQIKALEKQKQKLTEQESFIKKQKQEIAQQQILLTQQKQDLSKINSQVKRKEKLLQEKLDELAKKEGAIVTQNKLIQRQQKEMKKRNAVLEKMRSEIGKQQKRIQKQHKVLDKQLIQIQTQKEIMWMISIFLIIVLILIVFIIRSYKQKQRINKELEEKNDEINQQKEELLLTTENLSKANNELEKLSIVASETANAVVIADEKGNFEWVNNAFVKLYGYNINEYIKARGKNFSEASSNSQIKKIIEECKQTKKSITYETKTTNKEGHNFWIQTTLTPILNDANKIKKLVAVIADIDELKKAEIEISSQAEKMKQINATLLQQKNLVEQKNENINASIRAAQLIQATIFPQKIKMNEFFDTMILFKPKEIVSGDFYWYAKVSKKENIKYIYFATVDCTGHGVPGAFMSLIGSRLLNEIVHIKKIYKPADILEELNQKVRRDLNQQNTNNRDGMDIALIRITWQPEAQQYPVIFCGAKRNLYITETQQQEIAIITGTRKKIAGPKTRNRLHFENKNLTLQKNTILYLTSDGFVDQNNMERKRLGTKKFLNILAKMKNENLPEQKEELSKVLADFAQGSEQRDDITILAIKL